MYAFNAFEEKLNDLNYANSSIFHSNLLMNNNNSKKYNINSYSSISNIFNMEKSNIGNSIDESNYFIIRKKSEINNKTNNPFQHRRHNEKIKIKNIDTCNEFGTGFGLIIAKRYAIRLGHKIEHQSVYGEYTLITIQLNITENLKN